MTNIKLAWFLLCYLEHFHLSDFSRFLTEVIHWKEILRKNAFPIKLVDNYIKTFLNKMFLHTSVVLTVEKIELLIALPYLGNLYLAIRTHLQNSINKNLPVCKIKVNFMFTTRLSKFFRSKYKEPFHLRSNVVYIFFRGRCNTNYYSKTSWHLNIRAGEHSGLKTTTAIKDHMLLCDHVVSLKDFKILANSNS